MSLVETKTVLKFLGLDQLTTADKNLDLIHDAVETWVEDIYCRRKILEKNHKEKYDGDGNKMLVLNHYPITVIHRLSIWFDDAIYIKNTNSGAYATVSVTSTGIVLRKDGESTQTLLFADYTTMTTMVNAINAISGWSASLLASSYGSYPSSLLVEKMGLQCINNSIVGLKMPSEGKDDFEVDATKGIIYLPYSFPVGTRNVYVDYDAGYASTPTDLELAILILIKYIYQRRVEESFGLNSYSVSGISVSFEQNGIPLQAKTILDNKYRRMLI